MKKQKITQQDYLKAHRKASREEEIARHGRPARFRAVHKSKKAYDRKREKAGLRNLPFSFHIKIYSHSSPPACLRWKIGATYANRRWTHIVLFSGFS